jgi:hypothetical protein
MRSETAKTLKSWCKESRNFLKNGQDLRSRIRTGKIIFVCNKDADVKLNICMRIIYIFQSSAQKDQFVSRIYNSGAYVRRDGDFSSGFKNDCFYNGHYEIELEPSYIKDAHAIKMCADLLGGQLLN